ncbi:MAG TPA: trypsin-like peptidase domain-containing protein [Rhizomicrobium sp.]|jgi:hypothetical protein|nr:trypsin-like peptidase domain-containing protein [Rhizomicrobium sp.]
MRKWIAACLLPLFAGCTQAQTVPDDAVKAAICRPLFQVDGAALDAGTAFVLDPGTAKPLLVTAMHLFGPDGGLPEQIEWNALPGRAISVDCTPLAEGSVLKGGAALALPGAHAHAPGVLRDIAAFALNAAGPKPKSILHLADTAPRTGETVWLLAQAVGGAPATQLLHRAVVGHSGDDTLQYFFDNKTLELRATSGAPVLDGQGRVVGINLGGGLLKDGRMLGFATPLKSIREALAGARP